LAFYSGFIPDPRSWYLSTGHRCRQTGGADAKNSDLFLPHFSLHFLTRRLSSCVIATT